MPYMLDTDMCIELLRGRAGAIQWLSHVARSECAISSISAFELYAGLGKAREAEREREKIRLFISEVLELHFNDTAAECAATIRNELQRCGRLIGPYDLLIAGHAIASGRTLVTKNIREF